MIDLEQATNIGQIVGAVLGGLWAAFKGRSWVKKRTSKDAIVVAADKAQVDILRILQADNAQLKKEISEMARERNEAVSKNGRLEGENGMLRERLREAGERITRMEGELMEVRTMLNAAIRRDEE